MPLSAALTSDELVVLRHKAIPHVVTPYLSIAPQHIIAAGQINQSVFAERVASLTIDNTSGDWSKAKAGMTLWIGTTAGAYDVGIYRVRGAVSGSTLPIAEMNSGDPGLASLLRTKPLADNAYLSLICDVNLHGVKPRIVFDGSGNGTFYKDYDVAYSSQNQNAVPCWLNLGQHRAGWVNGSDVLTEEFTATIAPFGADTVTSYFWEIYHDGETGGTGTITAGDTDEQTITVDFEPGHYLVWCTVGLSNGAIMRACRHVFAHASDTYEPYLVNVSNIRKTQEGAFVSLTLDPQTKMADTPILSGTMCLLWEETRWSDTVTGVFSHAPLWLQTASAVTAAKKLTTTTFSLKSTTAILSTGQVLNRVTTPTNWQEAVSALMHLEFWCFYLLYYHSTVLMLHDVIFQDVRDYGFSGISESPGGLFDQLKRGLQRLNMHMNQRTDGTIIFTRHPFVESIGDRNVREERAELTGEDVVDADVSRANRASVSLVELYGFNTVAGTDVAVRTMAYGSVGGQGLDQPRIQDQLVLSQSELNERSGMLFALYNQPYDRIALKLARNWGAVLEPAEMYFVRVNLPASLWPEGTAFNERCLVKEVTRTFKGRGVVETAITVEPETQGAGGITMPIFLGNGAEDTNAGIQIDEFGFPILDIDPFGMPDWSDWPDPDTTYNPTNPTEPPVTTGTIFAWGAGGIGSTASDAWTQKQGDNILDAVYRGNAMWLLTTAKLLYSSDATLSTPVFNDRQDLADWLLVRNPAASASAVVAFAKGAARTTISGTASASSSFGSKPATGAFDNNFDFSADNRWSSGNNTPPHWLEYDFGEDISISAYAISGSGFDEESPTAYEFQYYNGSTWVAADTQTGLVWQPKEVKRFILASPVTAQRFRLYITATAIGWCSITEFSLFREEDYGIVYSSNTGTTIHRILTSPDTGDTGGDVDDFGLGVIMHAARFGIEYTTSYADETTTSLLGLTDAPPIPNTITCLRIPYRKLASQALNNNAASLQFIYGVEEPVNSRTLWGITFNATDGSIIAESDMTPIISGTTYFVVEGGNALETAGANTQYILAFAQPVGGGTTKLIKSTNGGTTWTILATFDGTRVSWVTGSTTLAYIAGADGIGLINVTTGAITDLTGDFESVVSALPARGAFQMGA